MQPTPEQADPSARPRPTGRLMYTVAEAAQILGIGRSTAYELILRGELEAVHIGRRRLISPATLEEILGERPPPPEISRPNSDK